jgi:hypothetical protein
MPPIYALARLLAFIFYPYALYFALVSDCYEAIAIASFFALMCSYTAPNLKEQKNYFRRLTPRPWVFPFGWVREPRSGLTWFNVCWVGVYQYCFLRILTTLVAVGTQAAGVYCEGSHAPWFAHIWIVSIQAASATLAMYFLIQFYVQLRGDLKHQGLFMKVLSIKLIVFLCFWQSIILSLLTSSAVPFSTTGAAVLRPGTYLSWSDLYVGIPSLLICAEMAPFAVLQAFAYPVREYKPNHRLEYADGEVVDGEERWNHGGPLGVKALAHAANLWDFAKAWGRGVKWMFVGARRREADPSYYGKERANKIVTAQLDGPDFPHAHEERELEMGGMQDEGALHRNFSIREPVPLPKLPIAEEFMRQGRFWEGSVFGNGHRTSQRNGAEEEEEEWLMTASSPLTHSAQTSPSTAGLRPCAKVSSELRGSPIYRPIRLRYDPVTGQEISVGGRVYDHALPLPLPTDRDHDQDIEKPALPLPLPGWLTEADLPDIHPVFREEARRSLSMNMSQETLPLSLTKTTPASPPPTLQLQVSRALLGRAVCRRTSSQ